MYARQITSEQTYTLRETKRIINAERQAKRELLYKAKQKFLGVVALLTVVAEFTLAHFQIIDECGAFIFMLPISICLLFTKERMM